MTDVVRLGEYRGRRAQRLDRSVSLYRGDPERYLLAQHLREILQLLEADRAAAVWVDEYGPGLVHVHCVLDVFARRPRRSFSVTHLRGAWESGVPGLVDLPDTERSGRGEQLPGGVRSACALSLGSDGVRAWFLAVDAMSPRPSLSAVQLDDLMFLGGECASVLLPRDLSDERIGEGGESGGAKGFSGWPILQDIQGREENDGTNRRIATRFLVIRLVRVLVDEDFALEEKVLESQVDIARSELHGIPGSDPEKRAWVRVLDAVSSSDRLELSSALLELGEKVEAQGHFQGALELHRTAHEVAVAAGSAEMAVDAARFLGRVQRRLGAWSEAFRWYEVAREIAEASPMPGKRAVVLEGMATTHREKGNIPGARKLFLEALEVGRDAGDRYAVASVYHSLMILEKNDGCAGEAIRYGWQAVRNFDSGQARLHALFDLGSTFLESGELDSARDALSIVAGGVERFDYRIIALDALGHIAALRGEREKFQEMVEALEKEGWRNTGAAVQAQIRYYRGLSYRALGEWKAARRWLEEAVAYAEDRGVNKVLFDGEAALEELEKEERGAPVGERVFLPAQKEAPEGGPAPDPVALVTDGIRDELREMRRTLVGSSG